MMPLEKIKRMKEDYDYWHKIIISLESYVYYNGQVSVEKLSRINGVKILDLRTVINEYFRNNKVEMKIEVPANIPILAKPYFSNSEVLKILQGFKNINQDNHEDVEKFLKDNLIISKSIF
jgi:hypothetical protein